MPVEFAATPSHCDSISQSVEVSGWDADGQFFVEIADLDVSDSGDTIRAPVSSHQQRLARIR